MKNKINKINALDNRGYVPKIVCEESIYHHIKYIVRLFHKRERKELSVPYTFILYKVGAIGDYILTIEFVNKLRNMYPNSEIIYLGSGSLSAIEFIIDETVKIVASDCIGIKKLEKILTLSFIKSVVVVKNKLDLVKKEGRILIDLNRQETLMGTLKNILVLCISCPRISFGYNTIGRGKYHSYTIWDKGYLDKHESDIFNNILIKIKEKLGNHQPLLEIKEGERRKRKHINILKIIVHPGGGSDQNVKKWIKKRWPLMNYKELLERLARKYPIEVRVTGSSEEIVIANELISQLNMKIINYAGKTTLKELAVLMQSSDFYIGSDSGVSHLSAYYGLPSTVIFAHSDYIGYAPKGNHVAIITSNLPCAPCLYWFDHRICKNKDWEYKCMSLLTVEKVIDTVEKQINKYYEFI